MMLLIVTMLAPMNVNAKEWDVKISNVDYAVELQNTRFVYICNQETIGSKVGTEYYMTYTVEGMELDEVEHQGVCGSSVPTQYYITCRNDDWRTGSICRGSRCL